MLRVCASEQCVKELEKIVLSGVPISRWVSVLVKRWVLELATSTQSPNKVSSSASDLGTNAEGVQLGTLGEG